MSAVATGRLIAAAPATGEAPAEGPPAPPNAAPPAARFTFARLVNANEAAAGSCAAGITAGSVAEFTTSPAAPWSKTTVAAALVAAMEPCSTEVYAGLTI